VFVTVDRNLSFQQNLPGIAIAVIVLQTPANRLDDLKRLVPKLLETIMTAPPGTATIVKGT